MICGLVWSLILNCQIGSISNSGGHSEESGKKALLEWVQKRLARYPGMQVNDFGKSWNNGMAFCALLHSQNPNLFAFERLDPGRAEPNLQLAFKLAEEKFRIPRLLDVEDIANNPIPDEKSIMTYVSEIAYLFQALGEPEADLQRHKEELEADYQRRINEHQKRLMEEQRRVEEENRRRQMETENMQREAERRAQEARMAAEQAGLQQEEAARRAEAARQAEEEAQRLQRLAEEERNKARLQQEQLQRQLEEAQFVSSPLSFFPPSLIF